jgi:hypothetical protein
MVMIKLGGLFGIKGSLEVRRFRPEVSSGIGQPHLFCIKIIQYTIRVTEPEPVSNESAVAEKSGSQFTVVLEIFIC